MWKLIVIIKMFLFILHVVDGLLTSKLISVKTDMVIASVNVLENITLE